MCDNNKSICVFCGSSFGKDKMYLNIVKEVGEIIGSLKYNLIYGGGNSGLMGVIAKSAKDSGSNITGIIPYFLTEKEPPMRGIELIKTKTMRNRKALMHKMSSLFIVLNGGIGTLDELVEVLTLIQLRQIKNKPVLIINYNQFWNPFIEMLNKMVNLKFLNKENLNNFEIIKNNEELKIYLKSFKKNQKII